MSEIITTHFDINYVTDTKPEDVYKTAFYINHIGLQDWYFYMIGVYKQVYHIT